MRILILDYDGVLVSLNVDWSRTKEELNAYLESRGIDDIKFGPVCETLAKLKKCCKSEYNYCARTIEDVELKGLINGKIWPDGVSLIKKARDKNFAVYIWSRNSLKTIERYLQTIGMSVDKIYSRENFKEEKNLEFLTESDTHNAILVTDHIFDIKMGKNKGLFTIGIPRGRFTTNDLKKIAADAVVYNLTQVEEYL